MSRQFAAETDLAAAIASGKKLMVLFYQDWCPFCMAFGPVYEKHAAAAGSAACRVRAADAPVSEKAHGVDVVPTILVFENGTVSQRLDGLPGRGLTEKQLLDLMFRCGLSADR